MLKTFKLIKCENKKSEKDKFKSLGIISSTNIINTILNYFDIFKNKNSNKKILNEKYFGTFDHIEIANVIEDNFILERYFSSYTLFKYSLLRIFKKCSGR